MCGCMGQILQRLLKILVYTDTMSLFLETLSLVTAPLSMSRAPQLVLASSSQFRVSFAAVVSIFIPQSFTQLPHELADRAELRCRIPICARPSSNPTSTVVAETVDCLCV